MQFYLWAKLRVSISDSKNINTICGSEPRNEANDDDVDSDEDELRLVEEVNESV